MRYQSGLLAGLVGIMLFSSVATAATRYVSDELSINMRRGPGTGYRISELVEAGDRLTTLSEANGSNTSTKTVERGQPSDIPGISWGVESYAPAQANALPRGPSFRCC